MTGQQLARLIPMRVALATIAALVCGPGCGGGLSQTVPRTAEARTTSAPTSSATAVVRVDPHFRESSTWTSPVITRTSSGGFVARLSPQGANQQPSAARQAIEVALGGIGWPLRGTALGQSYVGPGPLSRWTNRNESYSVSLTTNARHVSLVVWSLGGRWQAMVNQRPLSAPQTTGAINHHHTLDVTFSSVARRTVTFVLSQGAFLTGVGLGGGSSSASAPSATGTPTYWLGDSFVAGAGAAHPGFDDLVHVASRTAGLSDVTVDALGDTGYLQTNAAARYPNYLTRASDNIRRGLAQPKLIIVGGSINDQAFGEAPTEHAAAALYAYLARAAPQAAVVVVPFTSGYPVPPAVAAANRGIVTAARSAPNVVGTIDIPAEVVRLGGKVPSEVRSGALVSSAVKYHPSQIAHQLYGRLIGGYLAQCLKTLASAGVHRGVCDRSG